MSISNKFIRSYSSVKSKIYPVFFSVNLDPIKIYLNDRGGVNFFADGSKFSYEVGVEVYSQDLCLSIARRLCYYCNVYQIEILDNMEIADWLRHNILIKVF